MLATAEAANNALLACQGDSCRVELSVSLIGQFVCIEVRDAGGGVKGVCLDPPVLPARTPSMAAVCISGASSWRASSSCHAIAARWCA